MKKLIILAYLCTLTLGAATAQTLQRRIEVPYPGSLSELIAPEEKNCITSLALSGTLDGSDLRFLREMMGNDAALNPTEGQLVELDLSEVCFAPGGAPYIIGRTEYRPTSRHTLPQYLFYHTRIQELILPKQLDSIAFNGCQMCSLQRVVLPEGVVIGAQAFCYNPELKEVVFPQFTAAIEPNAFYGCSSLKELSMNDVGYISANSLVAMDSLERVEINGFLDHIDGAQTFAQLPALQRVDFRGPVLTTGGPMMFSQCPELTEVVFHDAVLSCGIGEAEECPKLKKYRAEKVIFEFDFDPTYFTPAKSVTDEERAAAIESFYRIWKQLQRHGAEPTFPDYLFQMLYAAAGERAEAGDRATALRYLLAAADGGVIDPVRIVHEKAFATLLDDPAFLQLVSGIKLPEGSKEGISPNLATLRSSAPYTPELTFSYTPPTDSLLVRIREYFDVEHIAGDGDDLSRIKNIMYWLHDEVRHDGSSSWPDCDYNAIELIELCRREGRGLNCRFLSEVLNDLYLSVGIPSRFVTCQSKAYTTDPDCHVINMVWCESLGKWIWIDASFAAYVTDENGLLLHPGEVRERLIDGRPLILNEDANWNHERPQTKEHYLENYMAKNLYIFSAYTHSTPQSEGPNNRPAGNYITLTPVGFPYEGPGRITCDPEGFWQAPQPMN